MLISTVLAQVEVSRLQRATEALTSPDYTVTVKSEAELRGFVANGSAQYGVVLTDGHAFCSCKDAMYRKAVCKHAVLLALHALRTPKADAPADERPVNLKLGKVRPGWEACA